VPSKIKQIHFILLLLVILLSGCNKSITANEQTFNWNIQVVQAEIRTELRTIEVVTLYTGEKNEVEHVNVPTEGKVFLLMNLELSKNGNISESFEWKDVAVSDKESTLYQRMENDSFIEQHNYSPRLTGLSLRFGEYKGWVCFEVPESAADGTLYLVRTTNDGQQRIKISK